MEARKLTEMRIEAVRVEGRYRKDLGDLESLAQSLKESGVINPITVTSDGRLIAGQRRLEAARRLGWETIPAVQVSALDEAVAKLRAERDENVERKEMTISERVALGKALEELERPAAEDRMRAGVTLSSGELRVGQVRDLAAEAVGMSPTSYTRAGMVVKSANDPGLPPAVRKVARQAAVDMDSTGQVAPSYYKVVEARAGRRTEKRRPLPDAARDAGWKLRKEIEKVERIVADDRYSLYTEEVATHLRGHLTYALETAQRLLNTLNMEDSK